MPKEIVALFWIGVVTFLIIKYAPMPYPFPTVIIVFAVLGAIFMAFRVLGWHFPSAP